MLYFVILPYLWTVSRSYWGTDLIPYVTKKQQKLQLEHQYGQPDSQIWTFAWADSVGRPGACVREEDVGGAARGEEEALLREVTPGGFHLHARRTSFLWSWKVEIMRIANENRSMQQAKEAANFFFLPREKKTYPDV